MGWNGTNLQNTWLRKQGRGAARNPSYLRNAKWFCDGCQREHGGKVCSYKTNDLRLCEKQFFNYLDKQAEAK